MELLPWQTQALVAYGAVVLWMVLSALVILVNKYILTVLGFPYPLTLGVLHMAFCSTCSYVLVRVLKWVPLAADMDPSVYLRSVVPIGGLYAWSLYLSNATYMHLTVPSIQMTKALMPVLVFLVGVACGLERYSHATLLNMLVVTVGVMLASMGEVHFDPPGFLMLFASLACEAMRLALVQLFLQKQGLKLNPVTTMYYLAPACCMFLMAPCALLEVPLLAHHGMVPGAAPVLLASACAALALNLSIYLLIAATSALTLNVAGVLKDWALIYLSAVLFGDDVTVASLRGYGVALVGVMVYNHRKFTAAVSALDKPGDAEPPHKAEADATALELLFVPIAHCVRQLCTVGLPALSDFLPTREPARDTPPPPQRVIDLDDAAAALLAMEEELGLGR